MEYNKKLLKNMIGGIEEAAKEGIPPQTENKSKTGLIFLIGFIVIIVGIIVTITVLSKIESGPFYERKKNFNNLRCRDPLVVLFPQLFSPGPINYQQNKAYCDAEILQDANKKNMMPMQNQLNSITKFNEKMRAQLDNQNKMIYHMRTNIEKQGREVMQKLYNLYNRLAYVFKVFARLFYKVFAVFRDVFAVFKYAIWTLQSMWNGPLGKAFRFFCFGEESLIKITRNNSNMIVKINEININDMIGENTVIGLCKFVREKGNQIYKLNNINVSGSHLVEYNNEIIRVKDHPNSIPIKYESKYLYSLITDTGRMNIGDNLFRDHQGDNGIETYKNFVGVIYKDFSFLEGIDMEFYNNNAINLYPGFTYNSYLRTNNGLKKAEDIEIEETIYGKKIMGIIRYKLENKTYITQYNIGDKNGFMVGIQFNKKDDYIVKEGEERLILGKLDCIGFLVEGGIIKVNDNITVADFEIVSDELREKAENQIA